MHGGFADLSLNHLGTPPPPDVVVVTGPIQLSCAEKCINSDPRAHAVAWPVPILVLFLGRREPLWLEGDSNGLSSGNDSERTVVLVEERVEVIVKAWNAKGADYFGTAHG